MEKQCSTRGNAEDRQTLVSTQPLPPPQWTKGRLKERSGLGLPHAICDIVRAAASGGGPQGHGSVWEVRESKADTSDRLLEALACTTLVAAKSGTRGSLGPLQTGTTLEWSVGATLVAHDKENLRKAVGQFAIVAPAEIKNRLNFAWLHLDCTSAWRSRELSASTLQKDLTSLGMRSTMGHATCKGHHQE